MFKRTLSTNATNSAAISDDGKIYVWGLKRFGLIPDDGKNSKSIYQSTPMEIKLHFGQEDSKSSEIEESSENLEIEEYQNFDDENLNDYWATSISLGAQHAIAILNDKHTQGEFIPIIPARKIFIEMVKKIKEYWEEKEEDFDVHFELDSSRIDQFFKERFGQFPFVSQNVFEKKFLDEINDVVEYKKKPGYKNLDDQEANIKGLLMYRLKDPFEDNKINLKELRDNLLERRASRSVVIAWGVADGGRLGIDLSEMNNEGPSVMMNQFNNVTNGDETTEDSAARIKPPTRITISADYNIIKVWCGSSHTLALTDEIGFVYAWGINNKGCLGLPQEDDKNNQINYSTPQRISKDTYGIEFKAMKDIACGSTHSMALSYENRTYSWGNGEGGRLGHGTERSEAIPKEIEYLASVQPKAIFAGEVHSACISIKNQLYTWGKGSYGRLGLGFTTDTLSPELVEEIINVDVEDVILGAYHSFAIWSNKNVYAWGGWNFGKLGFRGKNSGNLILPTPIPSLANKKIIELSAGPYHTLCINSKGSLYAWGNGRQGKLGIECNGWKDVPTLVDPDTKYGSLRYRNYQAYLNKLKHDEFQKENNFYDNDTIKKENLFKNYDRHFKIKPTKESTKTLEFVQVATWEKQTFFLSNAGEVFGCGAVDNSLLNCAEKYEDEDEENLDFLPDDLKHTWNTFLSQKDIKDPRPIMKFTGTSEHRVINIAWGAKHVVVVTQKHEAYSWGNNTGGQLGLGNIDAKFVKEPTLIKMFEAVSSSACGDMHSLLLADSGIVYFFGFNSIVGEVNMTAIQTTPESIEKISTAVYISAGSSHNAVIVKSSNYHSEVKHDIYTWGDGFNYQLGNRKKANLMKPEKVEFVSDEEIDFALVAWGSKHTLALDTRGNIWYWGCKRSVGIDDIKYEYQKYPALLLKGNEVDPFVFISARLNSNLALTSSGKIIEFGENDDDSDYSDAGSDYQQKGKFKFYNVHIAEESGWKWIEIQPENKVKAVQVSRGYTHHWLITKKGYPYAWGSNRNGRCGIVNNQEDNLEDSDSDQDKDNILDDKVEISAPRIIFNLVKMLKINRDEEKKRIASEALRFDSDSEDANSEDSDDNAKRTANYKYDAQEKLKQNKTVLSEEYLKIDDQSLKANLSSLVKNIHETIRALQNSRFNQFFKTETSIIASLYNFSKNITLREDLKSLVPKSIMNHKRTYEEIFSLLQLHPCYIK